MVVIRTEGSKFFQAIKNKKSYKIVNRIGAEPTFEVVDKFKMYNPYLKCNLLGITYRMTYKLITSGDHYFLYNDDDFERDDLIDTCVVEAEYKNGITEVEFNEDVTVANDLSEGYLRDYEELVKKTAKNGNETEFEIHDRLVDELRAIEHKHIQSMFNGEDSNTKNWKITFTNNTVDIKINGEKFSIEKSGELYNDLVRFESLYLTNKNFLKTIKKNFKMNYQTWNIQLELDEFYFNCGFYEFGVTKEFVEVKLDGECKILLGGN